MKLTGFDRDAPRLHTGDKMPKRSSKDRPKDINLLAVSIIEEMTKEPQKEKNPAAVALGKLGGKKGGVSRAQRLTSAQRSEIARKAALARWHGR